jgi:hypothetical protein
MPSGFADSDLSDVIAEASPPTAPPEPGPGTSTGEAAGVNFAYADRKIIRGASWRFIVTTLETETVTMLDRLATNQRVLAQLDAPWTATGDVPSDNPEINIVADDGSPFLSEGNRLLYGFRREAGGDPLWRCRFAGPIMQVGDGGEQDPAVTSYTAYNPWQYLYKRPVLNDDDGEPDGEFLPAGGKTYVAETGNLIALQILYNSYFLMEDDLNGIAFIDLPVEYGGTGQWGGVIEETDVLPMWNIQQGKSVGEAWDDLVNSGTMDIVLDPVYDPINRPGVCADLSIFVRKGEARNGVVMAWDKPGRSLAGITRLIDGNQRANFIKFQAGAGGFITGTPPQDAASIAAFKEYVLQQFFPDKPKQAMVEAMAEQILSLQARGLITFTASPAPERSASPLLEYEPGDTLQFMASTNFREEIETYLRVMSIPIEIDNNGVESVRNLLLSPELEGIS